MKVLTALAALALGAATGAGTYVALDRSGGSLPVLDRVGEYTPAKGKVVRATLVPSSKDLAKCMPKAKVDISVALRTEQTGRDIVTIDATGLPAGTTFTAFFLEEPAFPFGAAEYFGDITADKHGKARGEFAVIAEEAFASTLAGEKRVRADLDHLGMWFADQAADDFCLGAGKGPVTPFDGDDEAGTQAFNSSNSLPKAPLP